MPTYNFTGFKKRPREEPMQMSFDEIFDEEMRSTMEAVASEGMYIEGTAGESQGHQFETNEIIGHLTMGN